MPDQFSDLKEVRDYLVTNELVEPQSLHTTGDLVTAVQQIGYRDDVADQTDEASHLAYTIDPQDLNLSIPIEVADTLQTIEMTELKDSLLIAANTIIPLADNSKG